MTQGKLPPPNKPPFSRALLLSVWILIVLTSTALSHSILSRKAEDSTAHENPVNLPTGYAAGNTIGELMQANHATYFTPTPAPDHPKLALPWMPTRYVMVQLPLKDFTNEPELLGIYQQFMKSLLPEVDVMALFHRAEFQQIPAFLQSMEKVIAPKNLLEKVTWVPSDTRSIWVRDYGPIFAHNARKQLIVYDNSFRDPRTEFSNLLNLQSNTGLDPKNPSTKTFFDELDRLRGDDMAPSVVATYLNLYHEAPTILARPPLALLGGDFIPISTDEVMLSQSTLESNGGRADLIADLFKRYYGVKKIHFISHLPGNTINHLDFIVSALSNDTLLIASPPPEPSAGRIYQSMLHKEICKVLQANKNYLEKHFPEHRLIEVPMPPLATDPDESILERVTFTLVQTVAAQIGMTEEEAFQLDPNRPGERRLHPQLWQKIQEETGIQTLSNPTQLSLACQHYFGQSSEQILQMYVENFAVYRSYINSLLVVTKQGKELIYIPRYAPRTDSEKTLLPQLEAKVIEAYKTARPNAKPVWIDCDYLINDLGALHCFAITVP